MLVWLSKAALDQMELVLVVRIWGYFTFVIVFSNLGIWWCELVS
jgi:hypothetical protein